LDCRVSPLTVTEIACSGIGTSDAMLRGMISLRPVGRLSIDPGPDKLRQAGLAQHLPDRQDLTQVVPVVVRHPQQSGANPPRRTVGTLIRFGELARSESV